MLPDSATEEFRFWKMFLFSSGGATAVASEEVDSGAFEESSALDDPFGDVLVLSLVGVAGRVVVADAAPMSSTRRRAV